MRVVLKGVHHVKRKVADGTTRHYYYAWRGGPRIEAEPHSEAFAIEYARHHEEARRSPKVTLEALIEQFTGSEKDRNPDFLALAETTQRDHLYAFEIIKKEWPRLPIHLTQQKGFKSDIRTWHRSFAANPRKADKLLFSLSKVFSYAIENEMIEKNPCKGVGRLYSGSRRDSVWTAGVIATFRAKAPPHLLLPFEIAIATGQRQGDILSLSWRDYDGIYLRFRQSKSASKTKEAKRLKVRVHSRLKAMLDAMDKGKLRICVNSRGRPWTKDGFKTSWGKECARMGVDGVTFHDLRGTFITERAREGSSVRQIAQISGHSTSEVRSVLEKHYLAEDQEGADAVILRWENGLQRE